MSSTSPTVPSSSARPGKRWVKNLILYATASLVLSGVWVYHTTRTQLDATGQILAPLLTRTYPEILTDTSANIPTPFQLTLLTEGQHITLNTSATEMYSLRTTLPLRTPGEPFLFQQHLLYVFPVHSDQEPLATAVLSIPLRALTPRILWTALPLLGVFLLLQRLRTKHQATLSLPQRQLLDEIQTLERDGLDQALHLPEPHPFTPVADVINQLVDSQDRKDRQIIDQHHQHQVLLNNMSEGILTLDNDQRITGINPAASRWLHLGSAQQARGEIFYTVCRIPKLLNLIEGIGTGTDLREEYLRLERPGQEDRVVKVKGSPLIDQDQTMGVLLIFQDVTTLRRLETLRQDFVANVTHELRTPLTAIKGYAELMVEEDGIPVEVKTYLERILKQSSRMIQIIEDLLSLTRVEDPEDTPTLQKMDLRPQLESVIQLCEEPLQLRDLSVQLDCEDGLFAELHPPLFEQAIHNLLSNAIKYTDSGTAITLRAHANEHQIRIEVQDEGPGIPETDLPRIFERFYRVDKARSRAVGGTGLGLSIVKHITLMHQGEVGVESTLGNGATFWITLPRP